MPTPPTLQEEALKKISLVFKWWILRVQAKQSGFKEAHKAIKDILENLEKSSRKQTVDELGLQVDNLIEDIKEGQTPGVILQDATRLKIYLASLTKNG